MGICNEEGNYPTLPNDDDPWLRDGSYDTIYLEMGGVSLSPQDRPQTGPFNGLGWVRYVVCVVDIAAGRSYGVPFGSFLVVGALPPAAGGFRFPSAASFSSFNCRASFLVIGQSLTLWPTTLHR